MLKTMKAKWQAWLDGSTAPMFGEEAVPAHGPDFFGGLETSRTPVLVQGLPGARNGQRRHDTVRMTLSELRDRDDGRTAAAREYDRAMGPIARALLAEMDDTFARVLAEKSRARMWRGSMVARRSARNQTRVLVDVEHLWRDTEPEQEIVDRMARAITARALHASDEDAPTGLIPIAASVHPGMDEDPES